MVEAAAEEAVAVVEAVEVGEAAVAGAVELLPVEAWMFHEG